MGILVELLSREAFVDPTISLSQGTAMCLGKKPPHGRYLRV